MLEGKTLKTMSILFLLPLAVLAFGVAPAYAGGKVAYTFAVLTLPQGTSPLPPGLSDNYGGGTLYQDGTARGAAIFLSDNRETIIVANVETWSAVPESIIPGIPGVSLCASVTVVKGSLPPGLGCSPPIPISQTPIAWDFDMDGTPDALLRVTPVN